MRLRACAPMGLFAALVGGSPTWAVERIEVPIKQTVLSDGELRYSVPVAVGGSDAFDAMLDTGSSGLRILEATVPAARYVASDQPSIYGYGSGVRLKGVIAKAPVRIGAAASESPIPFQLVRSVECGPKAPGCPASRVSPADYRIGGDGLPGQGFGAIIGTNTGAGADAGNPLWWLDAHAWIIVLPRPGDENSGTLIINPNADDRSGFVEIAIDRTLRSLPSAGAFHDAIPGCLVLEAAHKRICGPTLLDTGAPGLHISSADMADLAGWTHGDPIALVFRNSQGDEVGARFLAGAGRPAKITSEHKPGQPGTRISAGSLPYFELAVLYDDEQHVIGLKRR